jgi:hypothetical protein
MRLIVLALASMAAAAPAVASQAASAIDLWNPPTAWPPAESGKPVITRPPTLSPYAARNCLPGMACGMRLLGTVQRNGAVELQVPALRW